MSRCLVTGAAGFIGSHLCEALLAMGHDVVGVDAFIPYYPRPLKETNLKPLIDHPRFVFHELDLRTAELAPAVDGCDVIFNEAAMAGLMKSWSEFELYVSCNIIATKHTKKGHDVFVVQLAERVSKEDYDTLNSGAKRIGG